MKYKELKTIPNIENDKKLNNKYEVFKKLINELEKRSLPDELNNIINQYIEEINSSSESSQYLKKQLKKSQSSILKAIEKELKLVPKNLYRNRWMILGMSMFGIPMGAAFGISSGNTSMLAVGIPLGMAVGISIGAGLDKKAFDEGRQLDLEIKN